jgi:carboxypeptidase Q
MNWRDRRTNHRYWTALLAVGMLGLAHRSSASADETGSVEAKRISTVAGAAMIDSRAFDYVSELSDRIGARMTGTPQGEKAIEWGLTTMRSIGLANVHAEEFSIWRGWTRGISEVELISPTHRRLATDAMGWVGSTPAGEVDADVLQVDLNQIDSEINQSSAKWTGKVLEVTRRGDFPDRAVALSQLDKLLNRAYEVHAVAVIAGQSGAKSAGIKLTHTGILGFGKSYDIPVVSMAQEDQNQLERLLDSGTTPRLHINVQNLFTAGPVKSANVVGEIPGAEFPEQVIVVSGHLDSWDLAQGATDNGCGAATALEAAEAIVRSGMRPKRTIRFVLFTGEEQGMIGSQAYVRQHRSEMINHVADINLDLGQSPVTGFNLNGRDDLVDTVGQFASQLLAFGNLKADSWPVFGSDNGIFTLVGLPGIMLEQDTTDYLLTHHSASDTLDKIDAPTLARNAAIEAVLAFWIADRRERLATPLPADQTERMLVERHQDTYLKMAGLWQFIERSSTNH